MGNTETQLTQRSRYASMILHSTNQWSNVIIRKCIKENMITMQELQDVQSMPVLQNVSMLHHLSITNWCMRWSHQESHLIYGLNSPSDIYNRIWACFEVVSPVSHKSSSLSIASMDNSINPTATKLYQIQQKHFYYKK